MKLDVSNKDLRIELDMESLIPEALEEGAQVLADETKSAIRSVIRHPDRSTGDLVASVTAKKGKKVKGGGYFAAVAFQGTGRNGTRNGLKAAELEYGNSRQIATPFADRAVHAAESRVTEIVEKKLGEGLKVE